jgi:hypothetical protein
MFGESQAAVDRLLQLLGEQMAANRQRAERRRDALRGPTRPRPQRRLQGSSMSTYRRPEPAGRRMGRDLSVFWLYYGGDGRLWVMNGSGVGGWRQIGNYFNYFESPPAGTANTTPREWFLASKESIQGYVDWSGFQQKTWSPAYGDKGDLGDWYDHKRTNIESFAISESQGGPVPRQLHVSFWASDKTFDVNQGEVNFTSTGLGSVTCLSHHYMAYASGGVIGCTVVEQTPFFGCRYWSFGIDSWSTVSAGSNAYLKYVVKSGVVNESEVSASLLGILDGVSAWLQETSSLFPLSPVVYHPNRYYVGTSTPTCSDGSWGGFTCPFDQEPPLFDWSEDGWPTADFRNATGYGFFGGVTLKGAYEAIDPFALGTFGNFWSAGMEDGEVVQAMRDANVLTEENATPAAWSTGEGQFPDYDPALTTGNRTGFSSLGFSEWRQISGADRIQLDFANPSHLNYLAGAGEAQAGSLEEPDWIWSPDISRDGFSLDLSEVDGSEAQMRALMASGRLSFVRTSMDGLQFLGQETVRVGGHLTEMPQDGEPQWGVTSLLTTTLWRQRSRVMSLASQLGMT